MATETTTLPFETPTAAIPLPGIYWLRGAHLVNHEWILEQWFIGEVRADEWNWYRVMGSDMRHAWSVKGWMIVEVGPRLDAPPI